MSLTLVYCLDGDTTTVRIRNKQTLVEEDVTLTELYAKLAGVPVSGIRILEKIYESNIR